MMLTFTGQLEKILDGTKTMTTRLDKKLYYYNLIMKWQKLNAPMVLDMFFLNPRNRDPRCYKIGRVMNEAVGRKSGRLFTPEDADRDGFDDLVEYKDALADHHKMSWTEVDRHIWTQIMWPRDDKWRDGWIDGPHPRKVA